MATTAIDKAGDGNLNFTRAEVELLAHALNSTRLGNYSASQQERLPTVARKLAAYLAESNPYKYVRKTEPKPPKTKKLVGFALTRAPGSEWERTRNTLLSPLEAHVASNPAPLE
jgi:hypothetical protein